MRYSHTGILVAFVVRIIAQLVQELNNRTFNDEASYKAVLIDAMLNAASGYTAGADLVSSGPAVNVTLAGASRMTRHIPFSLTKEININIDVSVLYLENI